ncbi:nucleopolyhedrovirus P10 family protein [Streptomyces sp. NPDC049687]|uniref:nucleopolyhedrovirus P10 family protein n=1 Tax=Streptomyces sp. NPDC049687 TaxID=3365596 RepID=UPI00378E8073
MDGWTSAVRHQLGLGRLLPLGGPRDGAWIAESAAQGVLRAAVRGVPGVRLGVLRIAPADRDGGYEAVVPPPPSGLPPGPLRVTADFAAAVSEPLPTAAARVRGALLTAAAERLGLVVAEVDLRVTDLLDADEPEPEAVRPPDAPEAGPALTGDEARAAEAALSVPGVTGMSAVLGRAVRLEDRQEAGTALPHRHARVEIVVRADRRTLDVAREVRAVVSDALPDRPTVAVLVTAVS